MSRSAEILLGDVFAASMWNGEQGISLQLGTDYLQKAGRPVLGQWFEDRLSPKTRTFRVFPPWFENSLPERGSAVRSRLCRELNLDEEADMGLLLALGEGLPGNVFARKGPSGLSSEAAHPEPEGLGGGYLRTSLGGMQLKFTLSGTPDKLSLPVRDERGESWILKVGGPEYPGLAENEAAIMSWCRSSGFDVPEVHVVPRDAFPDLGALPDEVKTGFLVRRFDRECGRRIHQEDFAQVLGFRPSAKYEGTDAAGLGQAVRTILGEDGLLEFFRRLIVIIATGNSDAHLKNWSLLYPNGVKAIWSPLYDQVATIAYPRISRALALRIGPARHYAQVEDAHLTWLWGKAGGKNSFGSQLDDVLDRMRSNFEPERLGMSSDLVAALRKHWSEIPLLRRHGLGS